VNGHLNVFGPDDREEVKGLLADETLVGFLEPAPVVRLRHNARIVAQLDAARHFGRQA
jgi:hypothetical protein